MINNLWELNMTDVMNQRRERSTGQNISNYETCRRWKHFVDLQIPSKVALMGAFSELSHNTLSTCFCHLIKK